MTTEKKIVNTGRFKAICITHNAVISSGGVGGLKIGFRSAKLSLESSLAVKQSDSALHDMLAPMLSCSNFNLEQRLHVVLHSILAIHQNVAHPFSILLSTVELRL